MLTGHLDSFQMLTYHAISIRQSTLINITSNFIIKLTSSIRKIVMVTVAVIWFPKFQVFLFLLYFIFGFNSTIASTFCKLFTFENQNHFIHFVNSFIASTKPVPKSIQAAPAS